MQQVLETERLILRPFEHSDAELALSAGRVLFMRLSVKNR